MPGPRRRWFSRGQLVIPALFALACVVESGRNRPAPTGKAPIVVDTEGQQVSLDATRVPVVAACAAGQIVRRDATGEAWECSEPEVPWIAVTGKPADFPSASHTHQALEVTDFVSETASSLAGATIPGDLFVNGNVGIGTTSPLGKLDVNGTIFQRGTNLHADYVFDSEYNLESIEEHSTFMWSEGHLPAVPQAKKDADGQEIVEVGSHRRGILEELEKAHIYIERLNAEKDCLVEQAAEKDKRLAKVEERLARLEELVMRQSDANQRGGR